MTTRKLDNPKFIEHVLNSNDVRQSNALMVILERAELTVEMVLNSIDEERQMKGLIGWA